MADNRPRVSISYFGLQNGTTNTLSVAWTGLANVENYKVKWEYNTGDVKEDGETIWYRGSESEVDADYTVSTYSIPDNAAVVIVYILPVGKTYTNSSGVEMKYWSSATWAASDAYITGRDISIDSTLSTPSAPTVEIDGDTITASVTGIKDVDYVQFHIVADSTDTIVREASVAVQNYDASYTGTVSLGRTYKVRCRSAKSSGKKIVSYGEWSEYSSKVATVPPTPDDFESIMATSGTEVKLSWSEVSTATSYEIEYTDDETDFDQSDQTSSKTGITGTTFKVDGLESDKLYYFRLRAVNGQGNSKWGAVKSCKTQSQLSEPSVPSAPTVEIDGYKLTASISNIEDADYIIYQYARDDTTIIGWSPKVEVRTGVASYTRTVDLGHDYKVRCRATKKSGLYSDWSEYSSNVGTAPASTSIKQCYAKSDTEVFLSWSAASAAETYEIQYAEEKDYLTTSSNQQKTSQSTEGDETSYLLTGLTSGKEYFFRVRAVNSQGESNWSGIKSVVLGEKPAAPTTWQSVSTCVLGESILLYWSHNSEDGSAQNKAEIQIMQDNGAIITIVLDKEIDTSLEDDDEKTQIFSYTPTDDAAEKTLEWRVRTAGATNEYGDWSVCRSFKVYDTPQLSLNVSTADGAPVAAGLSSLPISVFASVSSATSQKPISYNLSVTAKHSYTTVDSIGNEKCVLRGTAVYSENFDISTDLSVEISAGSISLENNIQYDITCKVYMDSGLTASATCTTRVNWGDYEYYPDARISYYKKNYTVHMAPYCNHYDAVYYPVTYDSVVKEYFVDTSSAIEKPVSKYSYKTNSYTTDGDEVYICTRAC